MRSDKRRLAIRKDNPLPLNVSAVKRLFRRQEDTVQIRKAAAKTLLKSANSSPKVIRISAPPVTGYLMIPNAVLIN